MDLNKYFGLHVKVKTKSNNVFVGFVDSVESVADSDEGVASIDLGDTKQFPGNPLTLRETQISSIEILD